jgi:hypothetical protein
VSIEEEVVSRQGVKGAVAADVQASIRESVAASKSEQWWDQNMVLRA